MPVIIGCAVGYAFALARLLMSQSTSMGVIVVMIVAVACVVSGLLFTW